MIVLLLPHAHTHCQVQLRLSPWGLLPLPLLQCRLHTWGCILLLLLPLLRCRLQVWGCILLLMVYCIRRLSKHLQVVEYLPDWRQPLDTGCRPVACRQVASRLESRHF